MAMQHARTHATYIAYAERRSIQEMVDIYSMGAGNIFTYTDARYFPSKEIYVFLKP